jgi:tRNA wybutosine-synthesizing protein 2
MNYQQIGDIAIFNKISKPEAQEFLNKFPRFKTVCTRTGKIKGKYRKPQLKVLASRAKKDKTITINKEQGILYKIDVSKLMFAKGNINERHRIAKIAKNNEIVVDMFAGIGYFSLPLAKKVAKVYAIELNPVSFKYLNENVRLNHLNNVKTIKGDCSKVVPRLKVKADRIMMGFLPSPFKYLKYAKKITKKGTIIHYSCLIKRGDEKAEIKKLVSDINEKINVKLINAVKVKSYSPALEHYVLDLAVRK